MARAVANFHARMGFDDSPFQKGATRVENRTRKLDNNLKRLSGGGMRRVNAGFLELSRGVEDFAVVFGTQGFAGGIRAAGNNLSQFASLIHPAAGAIAGLGVAALAMGTNFSKGADKAEQKINLLSSSLLSLGDQLDKVRSKEDFLSELGVASGRKTSREALQDRIDAERKRASEFLQTERSAQHLIQQAQRDFQRTVGGDPLSDDPFDAPLQPGTIAYQNAERERNRRIANARSSRDAASKARRESEKRVEQLERDAQLSDARELARGPAEEAAGIAEGRREAFENRQKRIRERNRRRDAARRERERNIDQVNRRLGSLNDQLDSVRSRRVTQLPSGADFFSADAQNRLSRIASGRFQGDKTEQKILKEIEAQTKLLRDLKSGQNPVKPINL